MFTYSEERNLADKPPPTVKQQQQFLNQQEDGCSAASTSQLENRVVWVHSTEQSTLLT